MDNMLWCCPSCGNLNKWAERTCRNCLFDFDKELATSNVAEESMRVILRVWQQAMDSYVRKSNKRKTHAYECSNEKI